MYFLKYLIRFLIDFLSGVSALKMAYITHIELSNTNKHLLYWDKFK